MDGVMPNLVVHAHYHSGYRTSLDTGWGPMEIVGLSEDGTSDNPSSIARTDRGA